MSTQSEFHLSARVAGIRRGLALRSSSLLVTVFGDAIGPRRQSVWLGSLIRLVRMFGLTPRLVRTSAARLAAAEWLVATRIGRRSFYALSDLGLLRVRHADRRIYDFNVPKWDGRWTLVVMDNAMRASTRQQLKRALLWDGFGQLAANLFAHPCADHRSLHEMVAAAGAQDLVAVLRAESLEAHSRISLQTIMRETFEQDALERAWTQFIARFAPLCADAAALAPAEAFFVRTLLIHEYRRVALRDPNLPDALLPTGWPGRKARHLFEGLYKKLLGASESFLQAQVETSKGRLAKMPRSIARRLRASARRGGA